MWTCGKTFGAFDKSTQVLDFRAFPTNAYCFCLIKKLKYFQDLCLVSAIFTTLFYDMNAFMSLTTFYSWYSNKHYNCINKKFLAFSSIFNAIFQFDLISFMISISTSQYIFMLLIIYSAECIKHVIQIASFGYKILQGLMESGKERIPMASENWFCWVHNDIETYLYHLNWRKIKLFKKKKKKLNWIVF